MPASDEPEGLEAEALGLPSDVVDRVIDPAGPAFRRLVAVMAKLKAPDGCPWDREQTHDTLARHLLEETYEVLEAIDRGDLAGLREELGDLVLQVVFHAYLAYEEDAFTVADVLEDLRTKLVRRHPHVFGTERQAADRRDVGTERQAADRRVSAAEDVLANWERIKRDEKGSAVMEGIPASLPALARAAKMSRRAAQVGFDRPTADEAAGTVDEELAEAREAGAADDPERVEAGLGDLLFAVAVWARKLGVEPETALRRAGRRFADRFARMEVEARAGGRELESLSPDEWAEYWDRANPTTDDEET